MISTMLVSNFETLKRKISKGTHDFYIRLNYGARSSKFIDYNTRTHMFHVMHEIDGSEEDMTERELLKSNIGKALCEGSLFYYD